MASICGARIHDFAGIPAVWLMPYQASVFMSVSLRLIRHIVGIAPAKGKYVVYALS